MTEKTSKQQQQPAAANNSQQQLPFTKSPSRSLTSLCNVLMWAEGFARFQAQAVEDHARPSR